VLSYIANNNGFYYHDKNMENQRKVNFLIVVLVLGMHAFLFWATLAINTQQKIDTKQQVLNFVDLGMSSNQVVQAANDTALKPQSQQSDVRKQTVKIPVSKVVPEKSLIKPVVATRAQNQFKVTSPKEDTPRLTAAAEKAAPIAPAPINNVADSISANNNEKAEAASVNGRSTGDQAGGNLVVPKEYQGGFLTALKPIYPPDSVSNGEEGVVGLTVSVSADGKAQDVVISNSSGYSRLDRSAKQAVLRYRFKPATRGGLPIPYKYHFNIAFRMPN
jgi:periplasmic protein TonB